MLVATNAFFVVLVLAHMAANGFTWGLFAAFCAQNLSPCLGFAKILT